jgi:hypothetical protein
LRGSTSSSWRVARSPALPGHSSSFPQGYRTVLGLATWLVESSTSTRRPPWWATSMT